ncbi:MAG: FG-GAP-like repeat-containing protein [Balneolaceae bacterium]
MKYLYRWLPLICLTLLIACTSNKQPEWVQENGYRWAEVSPGFWGSTGFKELKSSATNIDFENSVSSDLIAGNRNYLNGSGIAVADVDGDGWLDLYFAGLDTPNKLYKNEGGFRFRDITEDSGLNDDLPNSTGAVFADINGNGYPDLLVSSFDGENVLYINDGEGSFNRKEDSGLNPGNGSMTMALADVDGDGHLDLYITNYKVKSVRDIYSERELSLDRTLRVDGDNYELIPPFDEHYGIIQAENGQIYRNEYGAEDELYINDGTGKFTLAEPSEYFFDDEGSSLGLDRGWGLAAKFQDLNGDGYPDLYVCNDFWTPDRVWLNRGDGTFELIDENAIRNYSFSSMGVDFSDINNNGHVDIFVTEMLSPVHERRMRQLSDHLEEFEASPQYNRNSLYLNRGDNTYDEISYYSGLEATDWSWAARFLDVDLDGYEDVLITTGNGHDYQDIDTNIRESGRSSGMMNTASEIVDYPSLELPNMIFRNSGNLKFEDRSSDWWGNTPDLSHGLVTADLDNDGVPDLVTNRLNQKAAVYQNRTNAPRIAVRLAGEKPNTQAVGATIKLEGAGVSQTRQVTSGGDYLSGPDLAEVFAADENNENHQIKITWPDGQVTEIDGIRANRIYEISQSAARDKNEESIENEETESLFRDVSDRLNHEHHENSYDDFRVSPLLPFKLSSQGPGVAWVDFNRDGMDDLVIASGKGGKLALYSNEGNGNFSEQMLNAFEEEAPGDQTTVLGWQENNQTVLVVGSANYEQGNPNVPSASYYKTGDDFTVEKNDLPGILSTTGPVAAADYNGDGTMDLFVGGRFVPGQYPVSADSRMFVNNGDIFTPDQRNSTLFREVGMVTGALFTDYNQDGDPDLLVSTEWGVLRLFENQNGEFREVTRSTGLYEYKGWWNGITTGDFNNDGRPDIIATNLGENSSYQLRGENPIRIYYADFNGDGRLNLVEAYFDENMQEYVPKRRLFDFESLAGAVQHVTSHTDYARMSIDEVFNRTFDNIPYKEINTLQHVVFMNTEDGFVPHSLPAEAQFSAAFAAAVADYDNDGNEDVFLSQNTFAGRPKEPRLDSGRGIWLQGDGMGNFRAVPGQESGIKVYGQQRGAALSDFNGDGKIDLAVTQNDDVTRLFENQGEKAGLRIRLNGETLNQNAIGAGIRLVYADGIKGPRREIQAGSGYWSQNSTVQVMGFRDFPSQIEVTWPDGIREEIDVSDNKTYYEISK